MDSKKVKDMIKKVIEYHIEGDYHVYTVKHTPIRFRILMTRRFNRKWAGLPVEPGKIIFDNYMGSGYGCNGKYITEELLKVCPEADIVWTVRHAEEHKHEFPAGVRLVEYLSDDALYEYATAAVWVCNIHLVPYLFKGLRKKKGQYFIQTWHGSFGIKKIENNSQFIQKAKNWLKMAELSSSYTDYWISNSTFETNVYRSAFWNVRQILEYGHPRNDVFFRDETSVIEKVRKKLGIEESVNTVLYVPTYRDSGQTEGFHLEYRRVLDAFKARYGGTWKLLMRIHPKMRDKASDIVPEQGDVVDCSNYPDIQELMIYTDAVITDYSSCIFDFMLSHKPGFLYAVDADGYDAERGLYYPLRETPFPVAADNTELIGNIMTFNQEEYNRKIDDFLKNKGAVEDGHASERTVRLIQSMLRQEVER